MGFIGAGVTFFLEVLGAIGAFWGAFDVFELRNDTNNTQFRIVAMAIGGITLTRYLSIHVFNSQKHQNYLAGISQENGFGIVKAFEMPISSIKIALLEVSSQVKKLRKK